MSLEDRTATPRPNTYDAIVIGAGHNGMALATYLLASVARHVQDPLYTTWLNQHVESRVRATVISMSGQANALGQIAGGPGIGAVGAAVSLRAALALSGVLLTPAYAMRSVLYGFIAPYQVISYVSLR